MQLNSFHAAKVLRFGRLPDGQTEGWRRQAGLCQQEHHRGGHSHARNRAGAQDFDHPTL